MARTPKNKTEAKVEETSLADLKDLAQADAPAVQADAAKPREPKKDAQGRSYATGRRKESVARVWVMPGRGKVVVNGKEQDKYFGRQTHLLVLNQPFLIANRVNQFDVMCTVKGGGLSGQAGAIRHGIAQALQLFEPTLRSPLKAAGMLTRDARMVERKKVGLHKARRAKQWVKR
jgi:small subunit ribosomal protein S9